MQKSLVVIYLNGGNDGLNCFVPQSATEFTTYKAAAPHDRARAGARHGRRRRHDGHAQHGQHAGVRQQARLGHRGRPERRRQGLRHALRRRHGRPGLGPGDHPGGRLQPAQPLALREPRLLVRRSALAAADGLARALARHLRLDLEPAAGGLARLQPLQADPLRDRARVRARGTAGRRLRRPRGHRRRQQRGRQARRSAVRARATTPSPARAAMWGLHGRRREPPLDAQRRRARRGLPAQQRSLAEAAARGDAALGGSRHARHHDRLGQLRHARRTSSPGRTRSSPRSPARSRRSRPTWPRAASSRT